MLVVESASTSTQNRKWKSLLLLLVTLSDGERPGGDAWPRRIDSRGPSGLERRAKPLGGRCGRGARRRGELAATAAALWWLRLRLGNDISSSRRSGLRRSATRQHAAQACLRGRKALVRRRVERFAARQRFIDRAI